MGKTDMFLKFLHSYSTHTNQHPIDLVAKSPEIRVYLPLLKQEESNGFEFKVYHLRNVRIASVR